MSIFIVLLLLALLGAWLVRQSGWRFAATRLGAAILVVVLVTFFTSVLLRQVPGNPCITALGSGATEEAVAECTAERGLDDIIVSQYASWAGDTVSGDLGYAYYANKLPLSEVLLQRMPRTALLFLYSQVIALVVAIPLGVWAAYQAGRKPRKVPRLALPVAAAALLVLARTLGLGTVGLVIVAALVPIIVYHGIRGGPGGDGLVNTAAFVLLSLPVFVLGETLRYQFSITHDWYQLTGYAPFADGIDRKSVV